MGIHPLWDNYPHIQSELIATQKTMNQAVKIRNKEMTAALQLFFQSGGKLLRPAYFLLFTKFGNNTPTDAKRFQYAASLEVLHAATLVHDDIIDESPVRRDLPSIQATYGKDIAVYTGDFLFTVYFQLLASASSDTDTLERNAKNMKKILVGELDQLHLKNNPNITIKQYLQHVQGKTAQLFQLSCYEGAKMGGASLRIQLIAQRIGYNIGMAFQILDDILDFTATSEELHKPVLEDIKNGNYTLPLIYAMQKAPKDFALLKKGESLSDAEIQAIVELVKIHDGISNAQTLAERYTSKALNEIGKLSDIPEKEILLAVTKKLLNRQD